MTGSEWLGVFEYAAVGIMAALAWAAMHFVGKPILAYRKLRAEIARSLIFYANVGNPLLDSGTLDFVDRSKEASRVYRDQASNLMAWTNDLTIYQFWAKLTIVPSIEDLQIAQGNLIGLSNNIGVPGEGSNVKWRRGEIRRVLRIRE